MEFQSTGTRLPSSGSFVERRENEENEDNVLVCDK